MRYYEWILEQLRKEQAMPDLDFGPHRKCHTCGKLQPEPRCLEYNDNWYCSLICKQKKEREDDEALNRPISRAARVYR